MSSAKDLVTQTNLYRCVKLLITFHRWGKGRQIRTWDIASDVELGKGVRLDEGVVVHRGCAIGDHSYIRRDSKVWHRSKIGLYCSIGENVLVGAPEHPKGYLSTSPILYQMAPDKPADSWPSDDVRSPAIVDNDVWIGNNAVIRAGVHIGTGAIVGANAVVVKDVAPYAIVGGVPARQIGCRFSEELVSRLLESCWWEMPYDEILRSPLLFRPELLLDEKPLDEGEKGETR